jgi:hypothetical protein
VHGFRQTCNRLEIVLGNPMELLGDMGQGEARFGPFGDSVNLGT